MKVFMLNIILIVIAALIAGAFAVRLAAGFLKFIYKIAPYIVILTLICLAMYLKDGYIFPPDESVGTVDATYP